jgi:hypothetical protein
VDGGFPKNVFRRISCGMAKVLILLSSSRYRSPRKVEKLFDGKLVFGFTDRTIRNFAWGCPTPRITGTALNVE